MNKLILSLLFSVIGMSSTVQANNPIVQLQTQTVDREAEFASVISEKFEPFWQASVVESSFQNQASLSIHYAFAIPENAQTGLVISPGRGEGYLKYKELAYDFYQLGYAVFIIDHQGQGLSSRRLDNRFKGYVERFDDYVTDLNQFVEHVVRKNFSGDLSFVSHSMGGAIGLRYIQSYPNVFTKAVFSSPMWALDAGPVPKPIAKALINSMAWVNSVFTDQSPYFIGGQDYNAVSFNDNELTHSQKRYQYFRDIYQNTPQLQLGSVTINWIQESVSALETAFDQLDKVQIPMLVLQSGADNVIDNDGQNNFCQRLAQLNKPCQTGKPVVIEGAKHELFIEEDDKRNQALETIVRFLND